MNNLLHLKAPGDWINDPNGFIFYNNQYHLFYQYFPCAPRWGIMHWGHAVSDNLINWRHKGIALYPSKSYDRNGCFSGSAIELTNGDMALYYTGVRYLEEKEDINQSPDGMARQCQVMITSEDGFSFDDNKKRLIVPTFEDTTVGDPCDFRDPKVFVEDGKYYMVTASTHEKEEGVLLIHVSEDGENWRLLSRKQSTEFGRILECPDLFKIGDQWVLICSPMFILEGDARPNQSIIVAVDFDVKTGEMEFKSEAGFLDYGMDLYAPQSTMDKDGNRVYVGWMRMPHAAKPSENSASNDRPWNGMMSLPRLVQIVGNSLYTPVHPEVTKCFDNGDNHDRQINIEGKNGATTRTASESVVYDGDLVNRRIRISLEDGEVINIDGLVIDYAEGRLTVNRGAIIPEGTDREVNRISCTPSDLTKCDLEIFVEANLIEVFVNEGQFVISNIKYDE